MYIIYCIIEFKAIDKQFSICITYCKSDGCAPVFSYISQTLCAEWGPKLSPNQYIASAFTVDYNEWPLHK